MPAPDPRLPVGAGCGVHARLDGEADGLVGWAPAPHAVVDEEAGVDHAHRVSGRGSGVGVNRGTSTGCVSSSGSAPPSGLAVG
jgi:hypothetical protein